MYVGIEKQNVEVKVYSLMFLSQGQAEYLRALLRGFVSPDDERADEIFELLDKALLKKD